MPQPVQLDGSLPRSTQDPPHFARPGAQASGLQAPFLQCAPVPHGLSQAAQRWGSVFKSTHAGPVTVVQALGVAAVQLTPHVPDWHARDPVADPDTGASHWIGQSPQWSGSV